MAEFCHHLGCWAAHGILKWKLFNVRRQGGKEAGFHFLPRVKPKDTSAIRSLGVWISRKNPSLKVENLRHIDAQGFVPDEESSRKPTLQRCWCTRKLCRSKRGRTEVYHAGWWFIWCLMIYDDLKLKSKVSKVKSQSVWRRFGKFLISSAWSWLCVEWIEYLADA